MNKNTRIRFEDSLLALHWCRVNSIKFSYEWGRNITVELPKFCGFSQDFVDWLNSIECVFEYCHVTEEKKVNLVSFGLVDTIQS